MPHLDSFMGQILQDIQSSKSEVKHVYKKNIYGGQIKHEEKRNCSHRDFEQLQQPGQIITVRDGSAAGKAKDSQHLTLFWRSPWGPQPQPHLQRGGGGGCAGVREGVSIM